jgi:hypothetical protein
MYKLIIGNVRVTVEDEIGRPEAATLAREAVAAAARQGKLLSHIEITTGENGPEVQTVEKAGRRAVRKTISQSMADAIVAAAQEKLCPTNAFAARDSWFDAETGQEWVGGEVSIAREQILAKLEEWAKTV